MNATGFWTFTAALVIPIFLCTISESAQPIWIFMIRSRPQRHHVAEVNYGLKSSRLLPSET